MGSRWSRVVEAGFFRRTSTTCTVGQPMAGYGRQGCRQEHSDWFRPKFS